MTVVSSTREEEVQAMQAELDGLVGMEPRSCATDAQASEAASWIQFAKKAEAGADEALDPAIREAFAAHKKLTGQKKTLLEKLLAAKDRVRVNLANWIAGGHKVGGCYIKTKWRAVVKDIAAVPEEYVVLSADQKKLDEWATKTEGKVVIPGCEIEQINVLYAKETD